MKSPTLHKKLLSSLQKPTRKQTKLKGATFNIVAADDITVNGDVKYHKNDIVTSFTTDENGVAISPNSISVHTNLLKQLLLTDTY